MAEIPSYISTEFDLFARKDRQDGCVDKIGTIYKPIASVDQPDIEFLIPADSDTYIDPNIHLFIRRKLVKTDGTDLAETDYVAGVNNLLHCLFSQCTISLNGTQITQSSHNYHYRAYFETLLTYATDARDSHLKMVNWELDEGNLLAGDCSKPDEVSNTGFLARWNHVKQSQEVHMYSRLHADICNVPTYNINGVKMQIKLTKAKPAFYLLSNKEDSKAYFKVLEASLYIKRIRPSAGVIASHNETLLQGYPVRYNLTRIELKTFTFGVGTQSLSMNNAVLGRLPKQLIITMVKNTDFLGTMSSKPYNFRHYDLTHFALYITGKQVPRKACHLI